MPPRTTADRSHALPCAVEGGAFARADGRTYAPFDFGLRLLLDGVEALMRRDAAAQAPVQV